MTMTQITSMTGPVSSLRAQLRAQAEAALGTETHKTPFTDRLGDAIREVAVAQNSAANLTKSYELGIENDLSKVMVSQQVSSLGFQMTLNVRNKMLSAYKDIMNMPV
jgi:flagellar hook-basal body complex protein FliE